MTRLSALEVAIEVLVSADQQQQAGSRVVLVGEQELLTHTREFVDENTGKIAPLGLAPLRVVDDRGDCTIDGGLLVTLEALVGAAEGMGLEYRDHSPG